MFRIDRASNSIIPLKTQTFGALGFTERANLQEWIAKRPSCLGEELLIIQKEFAGFSETNERLDLLAIDKQGSLVLIENKLDDTGRDVTWQALKYASYCSSLSKEVVRRIYQEFLTSTVLWLSNFKLRIQCFRVTPYSMQDDHFLNVEQIIPTKDVEQFMIGIADKALDEIEGVTEEKHRHKVRREFWAEVLRSMASKSSLYQNISPGPQGWIGAGSGVRGVGLNFGAGKSYGRAELYIDRGERDERTNCCLCY
jgi:hypothetical protein